MHNANAEKSERLRLTLCALSLGGPHFRISTLGIQRYTGSMAPATDISELRQNGYLIDCQYAGKTSSGRKIFRYHLRGKKENQST